MAVGQTMCKISQTAGWACLVQPGVTKPGVTKPGVTKPGVTKPGVTKPGITKPGPGVFIVIMELMGLQGTLSRHLWQNQSHHGWINTYMGQGTHASYGPNSAQG